jgi:HEAT repeat protein
MMDPDLEEILERSRSREPDVRRLAAQELAEHSALRESRSTLLELIADPDWRVRRAAADSIFQSDRTEFIAELLDALYDETNAGKRNAAFELLGRFGEEILPFLAQHLSTDNPDVRIFLLSLLGDLRDVAYLAFVHEGLQHSEPNVVSAAITTLGKMGHPASIPHLVKFLKTENVWYQFQAIEAAGELQDESLLPLIVPFLDSPYCRTTALRALGKFHTQEAYRVLIGALIRDGRIDPDALHSIQRIFHAPQPEIIRRKESQMIRRICADLFKEQEQQLLAREFPELFHNDDDEEPGAVSTEVVSITTPVSSMKQEDPAVRRQAIQHMAQHPTPQFQEILIAGLADEDARARELAATALAGYRTKEVTEALIAALGDQEVWVRTAIYGSLDRANPHASSILKQKLPQENPICQAMILRRLGSETDPEETEILFSYLNNEDPELRAAVCEGLCNLRSNVSQQCLLERAENDAAWNVRIAALTSLKQFQVEGFDQFLLDRLQSDPDSSVRKTILNILREFGVPPPDVLFDFLCDPVLADSAAEYLLSCAEDRKEILARAASRPPAVRSIVQRIFE